MKGRRDTQFLDEHGFLVTEIQTANGMHHLRERSRFQEAADEARIELASYQMSDVQALTRQLTRRLVDMLVKWLKWIAQELARFTQWVRHQLKNYLHLTPNDTDSLTSLGRIQSHVAGASVAGDDSAEAP